MYAWIVVYMHVRAYACMYMRIFEFACVLVCCVCMHACLPHACIFVRHTHYVCPWESQRADLLVGNNSSQCFWAGTHPWANRFQQLILPNYQGTKRPISWCPPTMVGQAPHGAGSSKFVCLSVKAPHCRPPRDFRNAYEWCAVIPGLEGLTRIDQNIVFGFGWLCRHIANSPLIL